MLNVFCSPARYVQGRDATAELGAQMSHVGLQGPVYVVASERIHELLGAAWRTGLGDAGFDYLVGGFGGECSAAAIDQGTADAREAGAGVIVGAGGGKALDTARAIAANLDLPVVNCPTLASSDAPCSALSVLYTTDGEFDTVRFYPRNPDLVLVDTSLVAQAPRRYLVSGMGDALATWFEARTVIEAHNANPLHGGTTMTGGALARLCYETLLTDGVLAAQAVDQSVVTPALDRIVEANTLLSGLGFESGGLAIAHSVHNGLTTAPGTHAYLHGEKVAFGLLVQLIVEGRPVGELSEVAGFSASVGLPTTLAQIGVDASDREALALVAKRTLAEGETAHNEPFELTESMILDGILAADAYGAGFA